MIASTVCGRSAPRETGRGSRRAPASTWAGLNVLEDVADRRRRARRSAAARESTREERRLRGQPGDPVAQAGADGRDDEPPDGVAGRRHQARPRPRRPRSRHALRLGRHGLYGNAHDRRHPGTPRTRPRRWSATTSSPPTGAGRGGHPARVGRGASRTSPRSAPQAGIGRGPRARPAGQPARARADALRPLRQPGRRGRVPPVVALADGARRRATACRRRRGTQRRRPHAHVRRAAGFFAWSQTEPGHGCPISMTYAAVPALRADDAIAKEWTPRLAVDVVRPRAAARSRTKRGALAGMGMTEKQGGSDVRANVTEARPTVGRRRVHPARAQVVHLGADERRLPGAGAGAPAGSPASWCRGCCPTARRNRLDVVRLKDKLGNRSNASSELELDGTWAQRLGDEGRGVRTIIEMVAATRLDCVLGSASLMRRALAEASWHVAHRSAFGGAAGRQAADAERRRRPRGRVRGGHRAGDAAGRRRRRRRTTRTRRRCAGSRCRWRSSGSASGPR